MGNLQQEVISSQTAHQQMADQLKEALKDKCMLEDQMDASLSLLGRTGVVLRPCATHVICACQDAQSQAGYAIVSLQWRIQ